MVKLIHLRLLCYMYDFLKHKIHYCYNFCKVRTFSTIRYDSLLWNKRNGNISTSFKTRNGKQNTEANIKVQKIFLTYAINVNILDMQISITSK